MTSAPLPTICLHDAVIDDRGWAANDGDARLLQPPGVGSVVEVLDDLVAVGASPLPRRSGRRVVQERLAGHARREGALATDTSGLEPDDVATSSGQLLGERLAGRSEADDGDVDELGRHP